MYQPKIREELIRVLYIFAKVRGVPMTTLINEIVEEWVRREERNLNHAYGGKEEDDDRLSD